MLGPADLSDAYAFSQVRRQTTLLTTKVMLLHKTHLYSVQNDLPI